MEVNESMSLGKYWDDPRFKDRKPGASAWPDNFYRPESNGRLHQVANLVHNADNAARDLGGKNALVGSRFWYFGRNAPPLPNHLLHLVHTTQGHVVDKNRRPDDLSHIRQWLASWPPGIHGDPIDRDIAFPKPSASPTQPTLHVSRTSRACSPGSSGKPIPRSLVSSEEIKLADSSDAVTQLRKVVLSRKGFDSGYGGMPSPILPDGRLLPLPIPARHDSFRLGDLKIRDVDFGALLADLSRGRHSLDTIVHLDPDLDRKPALRLPGWRPTLGQTGTAQSHLQAQGVGTGDVFLFFGWFRQAEHHAGRWRFVPHAPDLHVLFGWLEVADSLPVVRQRAQCLSQYPWIADHPHVSNPAHYEDSRNTLYIAPERSAYAEGQMGGGLFQRYSDALRLTSQLTRRSWWALPDWFYPGAGREPLTYHSNPSRWSRVDGSCRLQTVAKGQEFVLDAAGYPEVHNWVDALIGEGCR